MGCSSSSAKEGDSASGAGAGGFSDLQARSHESAPSAGGKGASKYAGSAAAPSPTSDAAATVPVLHRDIVFSMCRGPGRSFFSGSEDKSLCWFDLEQPQRRACFEKARERAISDLIYAEHQGTGHVFSASRDRLVKQWALEGEEGARSLRLAQTFAGHTLPVSCVGVNAADARQLVSGARDYQVRFWDVEAGVCLRWSEIQQNVVTDVSWLAGEQCVLQASEDLTLRVWDVRTKEVVQSFSDGPYFALRCDVSSDSNYFLTGHNGFEGVGCEARLFDRRAGRKVLEVQVAQQAVTDVAFLQTSGLLVATASRDCSLKVWDFEAVLAAGEVVALSDRPTEVGLLAHASFDQPEYVQRIATTAAAAPGDGKHLLASGHFNGRVSVWEFDASSRTLKMQMLAPGTAD